MNPNSTRRALLKAAPIAAATLAIPASAAACSFDPRSQTTSTDTWDQALAAYRKIEARYDELCDDCEAADNAVHEVIPERVDRYFYDYKLGIGMTREAVLFWLAHYNLGASSSAKIDAGRTADEFMGYQQNILDARKRFRTEELDEARRAYFPTYTEARDALMKVPAPTAAALLVKMEIAAVSRDDAHAESTLADARRLIGGEV